MRHAAAVYQRSDLSTGGMMVVKCLCFAVKLGSVDVCFYIERSE